MIISLLIGITAMKRVIMHRNMIQTISYKGFLGVDGGASENIRRTQKVKIFETSLEWMKDVNKWFGKCNVS